MIRLKHITHEAIPLALQNADRYHRWNAGARLCGRRRLGWEAEPSCEPARGE